MACDWVQTTWNYGWTDDQGMSVGLFSELRVGRRPRQIPDFADEPRR
jgi:hypothetical protein